MRCGYSMTSDGAEKSAALSWVLQPLLGQVATHSPSKEVAQVNALQFVGGTTAKVVQGTYGG